MLDRAKGYDLEMARRQLSTSFDQGFVVQSSSYCLEIHKWSIAFVGSVISARALSVVTYGILEASDFCCDPGCYSE